MCNKRSNEKRIVAVQNEDPESSGEKEAKRKNNHGNKIMNELWRLDTLYNPTLNYMKNVDWAFVGGTGDEYNLPEFFKDAWDHPEEEDRMKWREAIKKEIGDMESRRVWKGIKRRDIPSDKRLIGSRWIFRVKRNGVFRARLVALGYSQIPGVNFTDT